MSLMLSPIGRRAEEVARDRPIGAFSLRPFDSKVQSPPLDARRRGRSSLPMQRDGCLTRRRWIAGLVVATFVGVGCAAPASPVPPVRENVAALPEAPSRSAPMAEMPIARGDRPPPGIRRVSCEQQADLRSLVGDRETLVLFANRRSSSVSIYWLDYEGRPVHYMDLGPDERYRQPTYVTHPWLVVAEGRSAGCLGLYVPMAVGQHTVSIDPM